MKEQKLANALAFLSLDCLSQFAEKLWIVPPLANWRLNELRVHIREFLLGEQFHDRYPELCWRVYQSNKKEGMKAWSQMWNWADSVFLYGGEDRGPERIWSLVLGEHWVQSQDAGELLAGISPRLNAIHESVARARKEAAPLLANLTSSPLSEWDTIVLPQIHLEVDFLTDKLDLMLGYNELVNSWRKEAHFELQELFVIHEWGKKRATKFGLREVDLPFPGCWEYGHFSV